MTPVSVMQVPTLYSRKEIYMYMWLLSQVAPGQVYLASDGFINLIFRTGYSRIVDDLEKPYA